ncbi:hypothetical protein [Streptomyces wuyuanensis]
MRRHLFLPGTELKTVYAAADAAVTVKQDRNANITANLLRDAASP